MRAESPASTSSLSVWSAVGMNQGSNGCSPALILMAIPSKARTASSRHILLMPAASLIPTLWCVRFHARINGAPPLIVGSQPIDAGLFIFTPEEKESFCSASPGAEQYLRPYIGAEEFHSMEDSAGFFLCKMHPPLISVDYPSYSKG